MSEGGFSARFGRPFRLGLVVNPLAGIGGAVGLKGSDGAATVAAARARGAVSRAAERAQRALATLASRKDLELYCPAGVMGEAVAHAAGFAPRVLEFACGEPTTAADTRRAAEALRRVPVDLLLFAGGDGTARDVCAAVDAAVPVLGIPAGVKMHSGVYAVSPEAAGAVVVALLDGHLVEVGMAEVRDLDEDAFRAGRVIARHCGDMLVPREPMLVQRVKSGATAMEEGALDELVADVGERLEPGGLYILGPGSTTHALKSALGIDGTLLGVDLVRDGACIVRDAGEREILAALDAHTGPVAIVVTLIGGQGHVFGRGNQQIGAAVIRRVGLANVWIVATRAKLRALDGRPLLADTNDPGLDSALHRLVPVITGYHASVLYPMGLDLPRP